MTTRTRAELISDFLNLRRFALIGVSGEESSFSRALFRELVERGYDVVPVNPKASEIEGRQCFPHVGDIPTPVEAALIVAPRSATFRVVRECAEAGVSLIWIHRGCETDDALSACADHGVPVIYGECPFMFLPNAALPHRIHGFMRKLVGAYPR